jgi:hypothetical protein
MPVKGKLLLLLAVVATGITSFGQIPAPARPSPWNILSEGGKGEYRGDPVCHPLEYFSGSPFLFDYQSDLYGMKPENISVQTQVTQLGQVEGRKVIQIDQNINSGDLIMKRLLVQRHENQFCAIYQQQYPAALVQPSPAKIEMISGQPVLVTGDPNGNRTYNEAYWTFDTNGPILLDLSVIETTLKGLLPQGDEVRGDYGLDLTGLCYYSVVWKEGECNACASAGTVVLKMTLDRHRLVVVKKIFDPSGAADESACHS